MCDDNVIRNDTLEIGYSVMAMLLLILLSFTVHTYQIKPSLTISVLKLKSVLKGKRLDDVLVM